ncbi:hypothetical protein CVT25_008279 [Psilocybe cyanescens]|uniref:Uncharacterized protein n=1 Tax=Psilocybe cyanescens TaxID=93625 RepID=A0A409XJL8_PSICY|nr:hypothetical protein CVT25_008279 [Psilocybe cyanescens]
MDPHSINDNHAGPSNSGTSRYRVQTSDVIQDMRVNVSEEGTDEIIWYKERFLSDNEIVENLVVCLLLCIQHEVIYISRT